MLARFLKKPEMTTTDKASVSLFMREEEAALWLEKGMSGPWVLTDDQWLDQISETFAISRQGLINGYLRVYGKHPVTGKEAHNITASEVNDA